MICFPFLNFKPASLFPSMAAKCPRADYGEILRRKERSFKECLEKTMGEVLWSLEYALKLQEKHEKTILENDISNNKLDNNVLSTKYIMGSVAELAGVSMSKVFCQMVKTENKDLCDMLDCASWLYICLLCFRLTNKCYNPVKFIEDT
ncbi:receptor-like protein kinase HERK 1 isoform X2 [Lycium barbarum]|uniref:receptor-like protein kinase HERK 1 isoform X2 n=2 Tax=Lycium barbarum TaxID=112863 RepID=UPI00293E6CEE|nr:receptor-like protein kinase HERK 1 isoform X2 [Lycium barbarum]